MNKNYSLKSTNSILLENQIYLFTIRDALLRGERCAAALHCNETRRACTCRVELSSQSPRRNSCIRLLNSLVGDWTYPELSCFLLLVLIPQKKQKLRLVFHFVHVMRTSVLRTDKVMPLHARRCTAQQSKRYCEPAFILKFIKIYHYRYNYGDFRM